MFGTFVAVAAVMAVLFVVAAVLLLRRDAERVEGWREVAARLGLAHDDGDPLGIAAQLGEVEAVETVHGVLDGVHVAAANVVQVRLTGRPAGRSATTRTIVLRDGEVVEGPRGWDAVHAPHGAEELEASLRRAARGG